MFYKYAISVYERSVNGRANPVSFDTPNISAEAALPNGDPDPSQVGPLFDLIRQRRYVQIRLRDNELSALSAFRNAQGSSKQLDAEIAFVRSNGANGKASGGAKVATLRLPEAAVADIKTLGRGEFGVFLTTNKDLTEKDEKDTALSYRVQVWRRHKALDAHEYVADFTTNQIDTPLGPLDPLTNEVSVGRIFQAIRAHKGVSIGVDGRTSDQARGTAQGNLYEEVRPQAIQDHYGSNVPSGKNATYRYDLDITLTRDIVETIEETKQIGVFPISSKREVHRIATLSSLNLAKLDFQELKQKNGSHVAIFRFTSDT